jgi:glucuronoarabinoxylan endo-1,4-beta-xylanase
MIGGEVNAWIWWVFLNDWKDNEGLTDLAGNSFIINKRLWAFGNYSRFVRPGWAMIGATSNPATNVFVSAFKDPSGRKFAVVAINNTDAAVNLQTHFDGFACTSLTPWVTDSMLDLAKMAPIHADSSGCSLTLRAKSVTTLVGAKSHTSSSYACQRVPSADPD